MRAYSGRAASGAAVAVAVLVSGCANGYSQFYQPVPEPGSIVLPATAAPVVVASTGSPVSDVRAMFTQGLVAIGQASFNGPNRGVAGALEQAKKVGASHIVVSAQYARTVQGAIPMTLPTYTTSQTTGTVNAYGSGGFASGTYSGTTTTEGSRTTYIPYSIDRYDQAAIFFAPLARHGLGLRAVSLTPEQAQARGSNRGLMVDAVRRGSPAFKADLLPGDVLLEVGGAPIYDKEGFVQGVHFGQPVDLLVDRGGKPVRVSIPTNADGNW